MKRFLYCALILAVMSTPLFSQPGDPLLKKYSDLIISQVGFDQDGDVTFTIRNRGFEVATPFAVEVYLDENTRRTVQFGASAGSTRGGGRSSIPGIHTGKVSNNKLVLPLAQNEQRIIVLSDFDVDICSGLHSLKAVVDAAGTVGEAYENNNQISRSTKTPCPDLTVASIKKNFNPPRTRYSADVVIINKGTGTARIFSIAVYGRAGGPIPSVPDGGATQYGPLAAGQTMKIKVGSASALESLRVKIWCDVGNVVIESDEENNVVTELLRP